MIDFLNNKKEITLTEEMREFLEILKASDEQILNNYRFVFEGRVLHDEEARSFFHFIRSEIKLRKNNDMI